MRRCIVPIVPVIILLCVLEHATVATAEFEKTKIAVLDFQLQGSGYETEDMGKIVAEWLVTALVKEGRFDVIERRLLEKILQEHKLAMTGVVNESSATKLGKLLGVKVIISGSVLKLNNIIEVNARIIDVESASIMAAESVKSDAALQLEELITQMADIIIKDFPLEGYVVHRRGDHVTLDLGRQYGVKTGMQFMVFKEGRVIKHPKTGEVLDIEKIQTGIVKVTDVKEKIAEAVIIEDTAGNVIEYGNMVKSQSGTLKPVSARTVPDIGSVETARLIVSAAPAHAEIRILNIKPKYYPGIELSPGAYHVEVSCEGYESVSKWIHLDAGRDQQVPIELTPFPEATSTDRQVDAGTPPVSAPQVTYPVSSVPTQSPEIERLHRMLTSGDPAKIKTAARQVIQKYPKNAYLIRAAADELENGYLRNVKDRNYGDAMGWLCHVIGRSGDKQYLPLLKEVLSKTKHRNLQRHAKRNYSKLK